MQQVAHISDARLPSLDWGLVDVVSKANYSNDHFICTSVVGIDNPVTTETPLVVATKVFP